MDFDQIIKSAINISDKLDRMGHIELADQMDKLIIQKLSEQRIWNSQTKKVIAQQQPEEIEIEIPEEEKLMLEDVLISLQESLKTK